MHNVLFITITGEEGLRRQDAGLALRRLLAACAGETGPHLDRDRARQQTTRWYVVRFTNAHLNIY